jgi:hypothetical protein
MIVFRDDAPRSPVCIDLRFRGAYYVLHQSPPKRQKTTAKLHGASSQKTVDFIVVVSDKYSFIHRRLIVQDLWPPFSGFLDHTHTDYTVGLLRASDQLVAETSTCTGQHNRQISVPRAGFGPATPATKQPQTALSRAAAGIGKIQRLMPLK